MGLCWSSPSDSPPTTTPSSTGTISSGAFKSTTTGTSRSNISSNSGFSAGSGEDAYPEGQILPTPNLRIFSVAELRASTRNFKSENVLGEGGFGKVFKGWLEDKTPGKHSSSTGTVIAVKKLNSESFQGFEEWQCEVNFLGRICHPNLVKLLGYGMEGDDLLLVYEYMQKGSLENHLFRKGSGVQPLSWEIRLRIAIGAAKGLAFLHASEKQVIYRDFKASNILLDGSYNAKISDFGLAKLGPSASQSHITTRVMGTQGYAAPEYVATGHLYVKSDNFGFGVVLAEILTGLRALDPNRPTGQHNLTEWVKPHLSERRKLRSLMDPRLEGKYPFKSAFRVAQLALKCLEPEPKNRPSMKEVVEALELIVSANEKPLERRNTRASPSVGHHREGHYRRQHLSSFHPRQTTPRAH
uniref:non-specific serine/threonine protein kinase n=1 Tax=Noccaea caerulescens TaxID=107243 RepID=A0A1J3D619_NOCCA